MSYNERIGDTDTTKVWARVLENSIDVMGDLENPVDENPVEGMNDFIPSPGSLPDELNVVSKRSCPIGDHVGVVGDSHCQNAATKALRLTGIQFQKKYGRSRKEAEKRCVEYWDLYQKNYHRLTYNSSDSPILVCTPTTEANKKFIDFGYPVNYHDPKNGRRYFYAHQMEVFVDSLVRTKGKKAANLCGYEPPVAPHGMGFGSVGSDTHPDGNGRQLQIPWNEPQVSAQGMGFACAHFGTNHYYDGLSPIALKEPVASRDVCRNLEAIDSKLPADSQEHVASLKLVSDLDSQQHIRTIEFVKKGSSGKQLMTSLIVSSTDATKMSDIVQRIAQDDRRKQKVFAMSPARKAKVDQGIKFRRYTHQDCGAFDETDFFDLTVSHVCQIVPQKAIRFTISYEDTFDEGDLSDEDTKG